MNTKGQRQRTLCGPVIAVTLLLDGTLRRSLDGERLFFELRRPRIPAGYSGVLARGPIEAPKIKGNTGRNLVCLTAVAIRGYDC